MNSSLKVLMMNLFEQHLECLAVFVLFFFINKNKPVLGCPINTQFTSLNVNPGLTSQCIPIT